REVKPAIADGTAMQCGRVGSRLLLSGLRGRMSSEPVFYALFGRVLVGVVDDVAVFWYCRCGGVVDALVITFGCFMWFLMII
ncbi:MAG: hypothetical protein PUE52_11060, partial [Prevotella sp.]|nr:hypothetical protein [Prevotella sp.]